MNFGNIVKQFFLENNYDKLSHRVAVLRGDGIIVYANTDDQMEAASIGALVGGLWQAAQSINSIVSNKNNELDHRLSFDTSSQGVYILPFTHQENNYYICAVYRDVNNPGLLKRNIRNAKDILVQYLSVCCTKAPEERNGYLFNEISDDEMDNLFGSTGI